MRRKKEVDFSFRFAEGCMYNFKSNLARLKILREKLSELDKSMSMHGQSYEPINNGGSNDNSPVAVRALKIASLEDEISSLSLRTTPIADLIKDLSSPEALAGSRNTELMQIMNLFYFGQNSADAVAYELNISRAKFYRQREQIVKLAIKYLGL